MRVELKMSSRQTWGNLVEREDLVVKISGEMD
jgi:hypothetical protein